MVYLTSKTDKILTINDLNKLTGETKEISGQWVKIETLNPPKLKGNKILWKDNYENIEGYVFDGFLKKINVDFYVVSTELIEKNNVYYYNNERFNGHALFNDTIESIKHYIQKIFFNPNSSEGYSMMRIINGIIYENHHWGGLSKRPYEFTEEELKSLTNGLQNPMGCPSDIISYYKSGQISSFCGRWGKECNYCPEYYSYYENGQIKSKEERGYEGGHSIETWYDNGQQKSNVTIDMESYYYDALASDPDEITIQILEGRKRYDGFFSLYNYYHKNGILREVTKGIDLCSFLCEGLGPWWAVIDDKLVKIDTKLYGGDYSKEFFMISKKCFNKDGNKIDCK